MRNCLCLVMDLDMCTRWIMNEQGSLLVQTMVGKRMVATAWCYPFFFFLIFHFLSRFSLCSVYGFYHADAKYPISLQCFVTSIDKKCSLVTFSI